MSWRSSSGTSCEAVTVATIGDSATTGTAARAAKTARRVVDISGKFGRASAPVLCARLAIANLLSFAVVRAE